MSSGCCGRIALSDDHNIQIGWQPGRAIRGAAGGACKFTNHSLYSIADHGVAYLLADCDAESTAITVVLLFTHNHKVAAMLRLASTLYSKIVRPLTQTSGLWE